MFAPWIGERYGAPDNVLQGRRLLVLGESHYHSDEALTGTTLTHMTREVVETYALRRPQRFFTNVTQVLAGRPKRQLSWDELSGLWRSIAFYNYVPVIVAGDSRVRPTREMFEAGREPFLQVLNDLRPEGIVVCGFQLWDHMVRGLPEALRVGEYHPPFRQIGDATALRMKHPSAGYSWQTWRPHVETLLDGRAAV